MKTNEKWAELLRLGDRQLILERLLLIVGLGLAFAVGTGLAGEKKFKLPPETARFKPGTGAEIATANCLLCHSADYISTQPPLMAAQWKSIVQKMREKYGALLPADQVDPIVDYLVKNYGKETATK